MWDWLDVSIKNKWGQEKWKLNDVGQDEAMTADKASVKEGPIKEECACVLCELYTRPYKVIKHESNSIVCCLFHLHFHEFPMNKGQWKHWRKDIYESLAVKWRALTFQLVIQCSYFCSYSLISPSFTYVVLLNIHKEEKKNHVTL